MPTNVWPGDRCERKHAIERKHKLGIWNANALAKHS